MSVNLGINILLVAGWDCSVGIKFIAGVLDAGDWGAI